MKPRIKFGLIAGLIGFVLNLCISSAFGICGPLTGLLAGAAAGFFAAQQEKASTKGNGARLGAVAGSIAGALVLIGQLLAGIAVLILSQTLGLSLPFGTVPNPSSEVSQQFFYYLGGLGAGLCFGLVDVAVALLAGAGAGYLGTPDQPPLV